ncbi:DUF4019 domain-containing protein [Variovorax sp. RKNM96]|nr:DUF4019 domain-containing protein [Variovorax sp. RKNM96]
MTQRMSTHATPALRRRFGICLVLAVASTAAGAQGNPQASGASADELLRASEQTLRQIDESRGPDLWNASAPFIRTSFSQADYVNGIVQERQRVGTVRERSWDRVTRIHENGNSQGVPAGFYASVDFSTYTGNGNVVYERLSFRLEDDGWHPVGYNARDKQ